MKKMLLVMVVLAGFLTGCGSTQPKTEEMLDILNKSVQDLKTEMVKSQDRMLALEEQAQILFEQNKLMGLASIKDHIYFSDVIPNEMGPATIIKFVEDNAFVVVQGYAVVGYDVDIFEQEEYENTEGYPDPVKGMVITYADDGLILSIKDAQ